jgi:purine nucleosidase
MQHYYPQKWKQLQALGQILADFALDSNQTALEAGMSTEGSLGLILAAPVAMLVALDSGIVTRQGKYAVEVETISGLTRGQTAVDKFGI